MVREINAASQTQRFPANLSVHSESKQKCSVMSLNHSQSEYMWCWVYSWNGILDQWDFVMGVAFFVVVAASKNAQIKIISASFFTS